LEEKMRISLDDVTLQMLVACAASMPLGPSRLAPMEQALQAIIDQPMIGEPPKRQPELPNARLRVGDPNVVYRIAQGEHEISSCWQCSGASTGRRSKRR
jgi:hypothetical protein